MHNPKVRVRGGRLAFGLVAGVALLFGASVDDLGGASVDDLGGACWIVASVFGALSLVAR